MALAIGGTLAVLFAACAQPLGADPSGSATAVQTARRTQNVPSRAPGPTLGQSQPPLDQPSMRPPTFSPPSPTLPPDPELLALIPESVAGVKLDRISGRASDIGEGGDMCFIVCPGELQETARNAGADPADVTFAIGYAEIEPDGGVVIRAYRFPGAESDLIDAWLEASGSSELFARTQITVEGRAVSLLQHAFGGVDETIYAFVKGKVLCLVVGLPVPLDPKKPTGIAAEALSLMT